MPEGLPPLFRFLSQLREIAPVFVTLGNHDHYSGVPLSQYVELADRHKITLLINQSTFIPSGSGELAVVGVDDPRFIVRICDAFPLRPTAATRYSSLTPPISST